MVFEEYFFLIKTHLHRTTRNTSRTSTTNAQTSRQPMRIQQIQLKIKTKFSRQTGQLCHFLQMYNKAKELQIQPITIMIGTTIIIGAITTVVVGVINTTNHIDMIDMSRKVKVQQTQLNRVNVQILAVVPGDKKLESK